MDSKYKLVQSVDPTKCRPKIRDKFAKLTLSSNKKKQEDAEMHQQLVKEQALQSNVSRNLLGELLTDDESDGDKCTENLLLRTNSSPSDGAAGSKIAPRVSLDTTHCSEVEQDIEKSIEMEPLQVSGMENTEVHRHLENIETLSSRLSSMAVATSPIAVSSSGRSAQEVSHIVSTENQKMAGMVVADLKCEKEPNISICISSSSSETSDSPITISDSSEGEQKYEPNVSPSASQNLHEWPAAVKADRMAAFLRDVRRNYGLPAEDSPDREYERRQKEIATADTEPMTVYSDTRSVGTATRIATADTESMTPEEEITVAEPIVAPTNTSSRRLALDDTEDMTKASETMQSSPHYAPVMKIGTEFLDDSLQKSDSSMPDDSLTIAETSEDDEEPNPQPEPEKPITQSELRPSSSCRSSSGSSGHDTQFQINISAKINIKIHMSQQIEESSSSESSAASPTNDKSESDSSDEKPHSSAQKAINRSNALEDVPHSPPERDVPPKTPEVVNKSDEFMKDAQRILTELYGNNWKTPEVMRSLKKSKVSPRKRSEPVKAPKPPETEVEPKDESVLDDFSIFQRNIPQDLDSTRLPSTPVSIFKAPKSTKPIRQLQKPAQMQVEKTKTKSGREVRPRLPAIIDTDSEGENASDDLDKSWSSGEKEVENTKAPIPRTRRQRKLQTSLSPSKKNDDLVYLDLSKDQIEVEHNVSASPPANHDEKFDRRLEELLKSCKFVDKPKLECTPGGRTKRKLFTAVLNDDDDNLAPPLDSPRDRLRIIDDDESVSLSGCPMPARFEPFNKHLESVKTGQPIFKIQTPKTRKDRKQNPVESPSKDLRVVGDLCLTPKDKYGFLKSLDLCVGKSLCHPDALYYRENYRLKKDELAIKLYEIYNKRCFNQEIDVPINWNKKLTNTAGRCMNKKRMGERTCVIELSEKVLTSADRLRCTLIHELCHAATWITHGEGGHNATWKSWARKANQVFPELPKIGVCHQYDIEYKYTYKCTLCGAKSHAHSKSKKVENIRCSYCHGAIEVYLNKKDKEGNIIATPVKEATGFAKFVKDKYKQYKRPDLKHADVMKLLSNEFAAMKVDGK